MRSEGVKDASLDNEDDDAAVTGPLDADDEEEDGGDKVTIGTMKITRKPLSRALVDDPPRVAGRKMIEEKDLVAQRLHDQYKNKKAKKKTEIGHNAVDALEKYMTGGLNLNEHVEPSPA